MDFLGLRIAIICLVIMGCSTQGDRTYTFLKYKIGNPIPLDTMVVNIKRDVYCVDYDSLKLNSLNCFKISANQERLHIKPEHCQVEIQIPLKVGEVRDIECEPIFPFVGERVTVLDKKVFSTGDTEYTVFKLYNEIGSSDLKSSTVFWVQNHGIAMIKLNEGEYFVVDECKPDLIKKVREDLNFSELWPIPAAPPPPNFEN